MVGKTIHVSGFPFRIPAETLVEFLEKYTGKGTVEGLEVKNAKLGSRAYARVQFTNVVHAQMIMTWARVNLRYGSSYLKAWENNNDFVYSRTYEHEMEGLTLNFGCQISKERFSVLWKAANVNVKFGPKLKNMHLFLRHDDNEYRLQLYCDNIWQLVLYNPRSQSVKMLLFQLCGAPRIFRKIDGCVFSYYMETPDDQWVRTTDFTPSCIGQSSGMCFQLPYGLKLPNLKDFCVDYKESEKPLILEDGVRFCKNLDLVPIIQPPEGLELPYKLLFKVCRLVQNGYLPGPKLDKKFFQQLNARVKEHNVKNKLNAQKVDTTYLEHVLDNLFYLKECCYDPVSWLDEQHQNIKIPRPPAVNDELVHIHKVQITPTKVYFQGPEVNVSNPVLRQFHEHINNFLRVSFLDEDNSKMYSSDLAPRGAAGEESRRTKLYERILSTLRNGIRIGSKKFEFLAFSSSQLRENSLWMFAPTSGLTADDIRSWMGDFRSIRNVAKYAARLGQSFSSSTETLSVSQDETETINDVEVVRGATTYIFSDGIGKISTDFARRVARKCGLKGEIPSAFQIRYGGYKGVVAVDPTLSAKKMSLRPSMLKYQSNDTKLNVLGWSKYQPCFLNRQIIALLSTLGVKDHVFEKKQSEAVDQLQGILVDPLKALEALDLMSLGENTCILKEMLKCGYKPDEEPFLAMMLQTFCSSQMLDLRSKSRIFIQQGRRMMGCLDETGTLKYGQVFVQFSGNGQRRFHEETYTSSNRNYLVKGKVAVAKNPCLHPGDLRVLQAVDVEALHHFVDCIVFPQKGERPHPNECSGSDLDGDIYFVCWDRELIPPKQFPPMDYDPAPATRLDHEVTIEEVQEYFTNYIMNESLGIIANAHTVFADKEPSMALSPPCLELATLHSVAVDFPKTGVPAQIPPKLRVKEYPDFMEKPDKTVYESQGIIGQLFRKVKRVSPTSTSFRFFTRETARRSYDAAMEVDGFRDYIEEALLCKTHYDRRLGDLMQYYDIKTEGEILSRAIMKTSKAFDRRKSAEAIGAAVRSLRSEARTWFKKGSKSDDVYAKASAWYHVSYHPNYWGRCTDGMKRNHYISFPWCVYDKLVQIKKKMLEFISKERFSALWKAANVNVKFGPKLRNMHLFLRHGGNEYRLQLYCENIWQLVLYSPRGQSKMLLFQLCGAPRIFRKIDSCVFSYYMETPDDQWVRTTDFTPSCIGQSSGMCFQLPHGLKLPNLKDFCVDYKESEKPLILEDGVPFCENLDLVPIIQPPQGLELPYKLLFKVCRLVQNGYLPGPKLDRKFFQQLNARVKEHNVKNKLGAQKVDTTYLEHVLDNLFYLKECCYDPVSWLDEQHQNIKIPRPPAVNDELVHIHKVQITPTKVYFQGPEVNVSNPVLRQFHEHIDNFLRVSFVDEDNSKMYSSDLAPRGAAGQENRRTKLYERILSTLRNGIRIGSKKFEFLAFSSSQLRENSLWMFAPTSGLTADDIRSWMGDFRSIQNVAKYAARLGQSFSSSTETLSVSQDEIEKINDVEVVRGATTYIFSDGIGKISFDFARRVARKCGLKGEIPSAFQIRYGGYKGVVAVDPTLSAKKMSLRPSMLKYQSNDTKLNVLGWSKYQPCFLNRQIIALLSTLGVKDHVFEKKQSEAVDQLQGILVDPLKALEALDLMSLGENTCILKEMLKCGYKPDEGPFLAMMLQTFCSSQMLDLRTKSRIFIQQGRRMMGCLDETGTLKYGQVFVQFSGNGQRRFHEETYTSSNYNYLVRGKVAVAKNPCLHPGDLRVLQAVDVEALHHFVDCIVFPQKGERPHPNECSGSDLDGDIYFVCWDRELIPPKQFPPMDYDPAPATRLDHEVTIEEVQEYFTNYIMNESLGIIANAHTVFADKEPSMALSTPCLELATLHSVAVDFPKTGVPAQIPPKLRVKEYPDFMEKPDKTVYESQGIIGQLFRKVKRVSPTSTSFRFFTREMARRCYDAAMEVDGFRDYIEEALLCKTHYDRRLGDLMQYYDIKTEGEILSRAIMKTSKAFDRRKSAEAIGAAVRSLRSEARTWFKKGSKSDDVYAKASAWYHVSYHPNYWGRCNDGMKRNHYISFPWCVYDKLVQIKKKNVRRTDEDMSALLESFSRTLM